MTETTTKQRVISHEVALHVLFHYGDTNLGQQPGKFTERLMLLIQTADKGNLALLRQVYPQYVEAVVAVGNKTWGLDWLRTIAREIPFASDESQS